MSSSLTLLAGPDALRLLRERGLRADDVDIVPGASGGPKWMGIAGIDRVLFGGFFRGRTRPLHLIGSSIGSWRLACLAQKDPLAAMDRMEAAYLDQRYPPKPPPSLVSEVSERVLAALLGPTGEEELLRHPWARLHVVTNRVRGLMASPRSRVQLLGFALGALTNLFSRRTLGWHLDRVIFHTAGDESPFAGLSDLPTEHVPLTRENLRAALLASASIPLVLAPVRIPGQPGVFVDGGVSDYHLDFEYGSGSGLVLYPHFYPYVVPGWFDKSLRWRRAGAGNLRRALLIAPSPEHLARLPFGKIPDREDFYRMPDDERLRCWRKVLEEGQRMGDELRGLIESGRIAEHVVPL